MKTWLQVMISIQTFWTKIITWNWVSVIKKKKKFVYTLCVIGQYLMDTSLFIIFNNEL